MDKKCETCINQKTHICMHCLIIGGEQTYLFYEQKPYYNTGGYISKETIENIIRSLKGCEGTFLSGEKYEQFKKFSECILGLNLANIKEENYPTEYKCEWVGKCQFDE